MIPYIKVPDFQIPVPGIGSLPLHPFGLLVATGVLLGTALATRRARKRGFDLEKLNSFITWMLVAGFVGGHVLDEIFYNPDKVVQHPMTLLMLWEGLSSFGGFVGAATGIVLWKYFDWQKPAPDQRGRFVRNHPARPILPFADLILSVFPVAWIFGRSGCSTVHDHPGAVVSTDTWLAVSYPSPNPSVTDGIGTHIKLGPINFILGHFPRYDLGLLELMFTVILASAFALTWRRKLPTGTYVVAASLAYAPVRFAMDFLRLRDVDGADPRYGGLTPAQWCCLALFVFGIVTLVGVRNLRRRGIDPADLLMAEPQPEPRLVSAPTAS